MNLRYNDEQVMLSDSARRLLADRVDFTTRAAVLAGEAGFDRALWREMAEMGWLAVPLPERDGGLGGDPADIGVIAEAMGEVLAVEPFLTSAVLGAGVLSALGDDAQRQPLADAVSGELILALADDEAGGLTGSTVSTTAVRAADGWMLNGVKPVVPGAAAADVLLVSARTESGVGVFCIPRDAAGLTLEPVALLDGVRGADVTLIDVRAAGAALLGGAVDVRGRLDAVIDQAVIAACFEMLGGLSVLMRVTHEYCGARVQFGRPLSAFQTVRHQLAAMAVALEEARAAARLGAIALNAQGAARVRGVSSAKAKVGRSARLISNAAVQLHGGMGVTEELNVGAYLKRALSFDLQFGAVETHELRVAALVRSDATPFTQAMMCGQERAA